MYQKISLVLQLIFITEQSFVITNSDNHVINIVFYHLATIAMNSEIILYYRYTDFLDIHYYRFTQ